MQVAQNLPHFTLCKEKDMRQERMYRGDPDGGSDLDLMDIEDAPSKEDNEARLKAALRRQEKEQRTMSAYAVAREIIDKCIC